MRSVLNSELWSLMPYGITLGEQEFGEVGAVLTGDAGDQGGPIHDFKGL